MTSDQMLTEYVMANDLKKGDIVKDHDGDFFEIKDNKKGVIRNMAMREPPLTGQPRSTGVTHGPESSNYVYRLSHVQRDNKWLPIRLTRDQGAKSLRIAQFMEGTSNWARRIRVMTLDNT